ncbi:MAG: DUF1848 domain-containing protein [Clostridia bacterium]|nr:DUF1848 domain-containing protein [Clostridia bacterium]
MIIQAGMRTDIPAWFSEWFMNRVQEGYVLARNPYNLNAVTRYSLSPDVADVLSFCTKNPAPMLRHIRELADYRQFWFVTITPYGRDIEPNVPDWRDVANSVRSLGRLLGAERVHWRYDPVLITERYSLEFHIRAFRQMANALAGYVGACVFSFLDLYEKTRRNFPEGRAVSHAERLRIGEAFSQICADTGIPLRSCCEGTELAPLGIDCSGCFTRAVLEKALGEKIDLRGETGAREGCACLIAHDIGAYNTCMHGCRYCYANANIRAVRRNFALHDPRSPLLIGHLQPNDIVTRAKQRPCRTGQLAMEL